MLATSVGFCRRSWVVASMAMAITLAGCAAPKIQPASGVASWNGRLALSVASEPPQSYAAGFDLQGSPQEGQLLLATPLGTTLATVTWAPGRAEMVEGGRTTQRRSLEELTADLGGTAVPVGALFAWLQGQPTAVDGWEADLSRHGEGRITAKRAQPLPTAELRLVFEP